MRIYADTLLICTAVHQQFFGFVRTDLSVFNRCLSVDKDFFCSRTQLWDSVCCEAFTSNPAIPSLKLYRLSHCTKHQLACNTNTHKKSYQHLYIKLLLESFHPWDDRTVIYETVYGIVSLLHPVQLPDAVNQYSVNILSLVFLSTAFLE